MKIDFKLGCDGELLEPKLHDAELLSFASVNIPGKNEFQLSLQTESKTKYRFSFFEVSHFLCREIYAQNIVREVVIYHSSNKNSFEAALSLHKEILTCDQKIEFDTNYLIEFCPSVGSIILVACKDLTISREN